MRGTIYSWKTQEFHHRVGMDSQQVAEKLGVQRGGTPRQGSGGVPQIQSLPPFLARLVLSAAKGRGPGGRSTGFFSTLLDRKEYPDFNDKIGLRREHKCLTRKSGWRQRSWRALP